MRFFIDPPVNRLNILPVDGWSYEDKKRLLMALQQCGTNDIAKVQTYLPQKTITDIRRIFGEYSLLASQKANAEEAPKEEDSAINQWIHIVKKICEKNNGVVDIVPRVLKYIAFFERRSNDREVNLRDCYLALSEVCGGMASRNLNPATKRFFFDNLSRLALKIKKSECHKKKQFIRKLKNLEVKPQMIKTYNGKKKNNKTNVILNPLTVPNELLKNNEEDVR